MKMYSTIWHKNSPVINLVEHQTRDSGRPGWDPSMVHHYIGKEEWAYKNNENENIWLDRELKIKVNSCQAKKPDMFIIEVAQRLFGGKKCNGWSVWLLAQNCGLCSNVVKWIKPWTPATLVRSSPTELPGPISTIHIAPCNYYNILHLFCVIEVIYKPTLENES